MVFNEDFEILAPGERTEVQGSQPEHRQVLEWVLTIERQGDPQGARMVSRTADDWLSARLAQLPESGTHPDGVLIEEGHFEDGGFEGGWNAWVERQALTRDPYRQRLYDMLDRPGGCGGEEPLQPSKVLLHRPLDPDRPEDDLWAANREHRAIVRLRGAPFLHRPHFENRDIEGLRFEHALGSRPPWQLDDDGWLEPEGGFARGVYAVVGERSWDRYTARTRVDVRSGQAGLAVALDEDMGIVEGLVASIRADGFLVIEHRQSNAFSRLAGPEAIQGTGEGPHELEVTLFDDKLRAKVGETVLEVHRGRHREGTLGLFLDGSARFDGLRVQGLEAYAFTFHTSRFASLADHIASFGGHLHALAPGAMGLPSASAAGLFRTTLRRIRQVETAEERQELFDEWSHRLALPWQETPKALEISRFGPDDEAHLLLLESPEALPFDDQLRLRLTSGGPPLGPKRFHPLEVISDGPQRRAILIPTNSGRTRLLPLESREYHLRFRINLQRFRSAQETNTSNRVESPTTTFAW